MLRGVVTLLLGSSPRDHSSPREPTATGPRETQMPTNTRTLIETLCGGTLGSRFSCIRVINRDPATGDRKPGHQGVLSVVFRAHDMQTGHDVALKFFDPDYQGLGIRYRLDLFEREAQLLERVQGKHGLLQLAQPLSETEISVAEASKSVTLTCPYFAIEWLDGDIEAYFLRQDEYDALVKLALFRDIVLGVFRLHAQEIAHRDVKPDNLRQNHSTSSKPVVVPIDLGTAIDLRSSPIGRATDYDHPVGAGAYSPLESQLGLASIRHLARATDVYALGCLLHDLFNADYYNARLSEDLGFGSCYWACRNYLLRAGLEDMSSDAALEKYNHILNLTKHQVTLPSIGSDDTSVPSAARDLLDHLLGRLTHIDYSQREYRLDKILRILDRATANLKNILMEAHRRRIREKYGRDRRVKREANEARLQAYLQRQQAGDPQC